MPSALTVATPSDVSAEGRPAPLPWAGMTVMVLLAGAALDRAVVIARSGQPSGVDFGNWLMLGRQILGHPLVRAAHVSYPPVVPVLSVLFADVLGVVAGTAILAGLASVAPAAGVYLGCRLLGLRWSAVAPAALLAATSSSGEVAAWGGVPQLVALGLAAVGLGLAARALTTRQSRQALPVGGVLLAVGATSHLVLAETLVLFVFLVLVFLALAPRRFAPRCWLGRNGWFAVAGLAAAPLVALVPLYLRLLTTVGQSFVHGDPTAGAARLPAFLSALRVVYRDTPAVWIPALVLTALTPLLLLTRRHRRDPALAVLAALVVSVLADAALSNQARLVYLAPVAVTVAGAVWLRGMGRLRWAVSESYLGWRFPLSGPMAAGLVALTMVASVRGLAFFPIQRAFYGGFDPPGMMAALDWLHHNTPPDALIAVTPVSGAPFGWWVQGVGRRAALIGSQDRWLNVPAERRRADEALALFSRPNPLDPAALADARALHVDYLVLPWVWGGLRFVDFQTFERQNPGAVVYDAVSMLIVRVPSGLTPGHSLIDQ